MGLGAASLGTSAHNPPRETQTSLLWPQHAEPPAPGAGRTPRLQPVSPGPAHRRPPLAGVVLVFSASAFGAYFRLMQGGPGNSSHVQLLSPLSVEPASASVGLAWLAVGSVCLFIAGEKGVRGEVGGATGTSHHRQLPEAPSKPGLPSLPL